MKQRYHCSYTRRRQAVEGNPNLNGIDWIEIDSVQQDRLRVGFLKPLPGEVNGVPAAPALVADNFLITGGGRVPTVAVNAPPMANGQDLVLELEGAGDFSTYSLKIVDPNDDALTPDGFDPVLSEIFFSFKVTCPTPFDCREDNSCPPDPAQPFVINRLARDFDSIRQALVERWQSVDPEFSDPPMADTRAVMLDLFAATGDYLSHQQDAATTEASLRNARLRPSVRRHARLLDYPVHEGCNARTFVHFEIDGGTAADGFELARGAELLTGDGDEAVIDTKTRDELIRGSAQVFETRQTIELRSAHNAFSFHTFHESYCCLARGATEAVLQASGAETLAPGHFLLFEETREPLSGLEAEANPEHRHVVRLSEVINETDIVDGQVLLRVRWDRADALPFPLALLAETADPLDPTQRLAAAVALGNVVPVDHGRSFSDLPLVSEARPPLRDGRYRIPGYNLSFEHVFDPDAPAQLFLEPDLELADPAITLDDGTDEWLARPDLLSSLHDQPHFVVEMNEDRSGSVRFGDDTFGKAVGDASSFRVSLRLGNGPEGNIGRDTLRHLVDGPTGIVAIRNPLPGVAGTAPESLARVRQFAPEAFYTQERAVTMEDFRVMSKRHEDVQDASAELRWTGSHHTVFLAVDRFEGREVTPTFKTEFTTHIERYRMAGLDLEVREPERVPLEIELTICVDARTLRAHVLQALTQSFTSGYQPNGDLGFFHPDRFTFGLPLYLSALIEAGMRVPGVTRIIPEIFKPLYELSANEIADGVIRPANHQILQLRNDPNFPEKGTLKLKLSGGL